MTNVIEFPAPPVSDRPLTEEEQSLVADQFSHLPAIAARVARRMPPSIERDDLIQVGAVALLKAVQTWDRDKGPWDQWAQYKACYAMWSSVRRKNYVDATSLALQERTLSYTPDEAQLANEAARRIAVAVEVLTPREAAIIADLYWYELTKAECAAKYGISPGRISQVHALALEKLRAAMDAPSGDDVVILLAA